MMARALASKASALYALHRFEQALIYYNRKKGLPNER
jgi:hypothetical protein